MSCLLKDDVQVLSNIVTFTHTEDQDDEEYENEEEKLEEIKEEIQEMREKLEDEEIAGELFETKYKLDQIQDGIVTEVIKDKIEELEDKIDEIEDLIKKIEGEE